VPSGEAWGIVNLLTKGSFIIAKVNNDSIKTLPNSQTFNAEIL
jgi:hypothetical protein